MVSRRKFIKTMVGAAAAAGTASAGFSLVAAPALSPYPKPGIRLREGTFVYTADEGAKKQNVWYLDKVGQEAMAADFDVPGKGAQVIWNGFAAMLIKLDRKRFVNLKGEATVANPEGKSYKVVPGTPGIVDDIIGLWGICPHACCKPNWRISRPDVQNLIWCICHDSRYDPHALVLDKSPTGVQYRCAMFAGGPAKRGLPQIPMKKGADGKLIGIPDNVEWYQYCGVNLEAGREE